MLEEIQRDELAETLYRSPWLTQGGQGDWAEILKEAATNGTTENISRLEVYRARMSAQPRRESEMKLGLLVEPEVILIDLRNTHGTEPSFGLPPGPNTGLSLRYPH
jgi:hypothetical protein